MLTLKVIDEDALESSISFDIVTENTAMDSLLKRNDSDAKF